MNKIVTISARVPDDIYQELKMVLLKKRMTLTEWIIKQMQRTVDDYKAAHEGE